MGPPAALADLRPRRLLRLLADAPRPRHAHAYGLAIVQSMEPGEDWRCCYVDETFV
jgi:hypothetical protein